MSFIGTIIAKILEYFLTIFAKYIADSWKKKKEIERDEQAASDNAKKMDEATTHEEKVKAGEGLLNGD